MGRFIGFGLKTKKTHKASRLQRVTALFLCFSFCATLILPSVTTYALSLSSKHDYAGALSAGKTNEQVASDATSGPSEQSKSTQLAGNTDGPGIKQPSKHEEIVSKRTVNTKTFDLGNGKFEVRDYMGPVHFKDDGKWKQIDTSLVEDANAAESTNILGEAIAWVKDKTQTLHTYKVKANDWQAKFAASDDPVGMVRIEAGGKKISFSPRGANGGVVPDVRKNDQGVETVTYKDLWPSVDVVYSVKNEMLKEEILLKNKSVTTNFAYGVTGASLVKNKDGGFNISGTKQTLTELSVTLQKSGPTSDKVISQDFNDGVLQIKLDKSWLTKQADDQFPVVIDPSWTNSGTVSWNYTAYKSDGYVCSSSVCYMNAGELYDNGWKNWRTIFCPGDMSYMAGKVVTYAGMYLQQANRSYLVGYNSDRYFAMQHASYWGYGGIDGGVSGSSALINYAGYINMTGQVQTEVNRGDFGACWALWGEEWAGYTYKGFDPDISYMHYEYSTTPATPTVVTPQSNQTFTDPQVTFQINPVGDADGDPVHYYYRIATGSDGESGTVINSGDVDSTQWTVPDGVLQDGMTYYLHVYSRDPYAYSAPSNPIPFKIDSRQGKDKTQTYDTVGPVSIDLTNGNVSTSASSHGSSALGGSLGVSLDYSSPLRSRQGLVGSYWNNTNQSGDPVLTRVDKNVDFNWDQGSPSAGVINNDNFSAQWTGYFVAPTSGTYYFGASNDDGLSITVDGQSMYSQGCYSGVCYDTSKSITLSAGQSVRITVSYAEGGGLAYAHLYVKGAVPEQVIPQAWLQTDPRPVALPHGLTGAYYTSNSGYNLDASGMTPFLRRQDPVLNFQWGTGSPVPGGAADFMARWTGYVALTEGDYVFGTNADDGAKIKIGDIQVVDNYNNGCCAEKYGASYHFKTGIYPIQIDYYDVGGPASLSVLVKQNGATSGTVVPTSWLSPNAQVLPAGWQLGIDPDGNLNYDHLTANASTVTLSDSSGSTHTYTWTGAPNSTVGSYRPPVNEDGQLTRGSDGKYTLIDSDGRTYIFKVDGTLESVTNPTDDRNPAALKYTYGGTPAHITQITDGVDSSRYAKVYYSGDGNNMCAARPDGSYIDPADPSISGYLCGVQTNDGRVTSFYYATFNGATQLALIVKPGNERTSYQYDQNGMLTAVRNSVAEDAVGQGVRTADNTVLTQISYDALGRATGVTAPSANSGDARQQQTFEYASDYMKDWAPAESTGTSNVSTPVAVSWGGDRVDLFARGAASDLVHKWYSNGVWSDWESLGGCIIGNPAVSSWAAGRLDVFVQGCNSSGNNLVHRAYDNGQWYGWDQPSINQRIVGSPSVVSWGYMRLDYVARGVDNQLYHGWWTPGGWGADASFGGCLSSSPTISSPMSGQLDIYVTGCNGLADNSIYLMTFRNGWSSYILQDGFMAQSLTVGKIADGGTEVVARKSDGSLYARKPTDAAWASLSSCANDTPSISSHSTYLQLFYTDCSSLNLNHQVLPYYQGFAKEHIVGAAEPNGFTRRVEYDRAFRTTKDIDVTGNATVQQWDAVKDLLYSSTDAKGLKSTTIYDADDRPTDTYGPAPAAWYGTDNKPLAPYISQVPHTASSYDEGLTGPAVTYMSVAQSGRGGILANGQSMTRGQSMTSQDGRFTFIYQTDGNVVLYGPNGAMWDSHTGGVASNVLVMQSDGNLVLYNGGSAVWATGTGGGNTSYLTVQNDGNLVIYTATGFTWASNTYGWLTGENNAVSLMGAPLLHTTNIGGNSAQVSNSFGTSSPIPGKTTNWGMRMTGKLVLHAPGNWTFRIVSDGGVRMTINDQVVMTDWYDGQTRSHPSYTFNNTADGLHRFSIDYYHLAGNANFTLYMTPPGQGETANVAQYIAPDYGLLTSTTTYDSTLGNSTTTINYGANPEYGLAQGVTSGDLTSSTTYESPTASDSFMRATSNTSAGGTTTSYAYYAKNETADNPCTTNTVEAYREGGKQKLKTSADPDGSGSQTSITTETIYDDAGRVVATRMNNDPWTCTTYDARGRVTQVVQPDINGRTGRIVTTDYSYQGSPLKVQTVDSVAGTTVTTVDLLGRQVSGTDQFGNNYSATYDSLGRAASRTSPIGTETYSYDDYSRPTSYALNGTTYATMTYDAYSRIQSVQYPQAKDSQGHDLALSQIGYDALQRTNGATFLFSNGTTYSEVVNMSQSDNVTSVTDSLNGVSATSAYAYDNDGRLAQATVDNMRYTYDYSAPSASACSQSGANLNAYKNSDRTSFTATNLATNQVTAQSSYCYDQADRLISSSDTQLSTPSYDDHGNTTGLAGNGTPMTFTYDASDQNTAISQGQNRVTYLKAADGSILHKKVYQNGTLTKSYRYVSGGQILQTCSLSDDTVCVDLDTYLSLPGGISVTLTPSNPDTSKRVVYSVGNFHGDTALTVDSQGSPTSSVFMYEPFGQPSASATFGTNGDPTNTSDTAKTWAGRQSENLFTLAVVQMGARVYVPSLGRFLQVDPIPGGTPSAYGYVNDPINDNDYTGMFGWSSIVNAAKQVGKFVKKHAIQIVAVAVAVIVAGVLIARAADTGNISIAPGVARAYTATTSALNGAFNAAAKATAAAAKGVQAAMKALSAAARSDPAPQGPGAAVGSRSAPLMNRDLAYTLGNKETTINGRLYSGHALDEMQNAGIYPSVVENTVKWGSRVPSSDPATIRLYESENDITVVLNSNGNTVTTFWGGK